MRVSTNHIGQSQSPKLTSTTSGTLGWQVELDHDTSAYATTDEAEQLAADGAAVAAAIHDRETAIVTDEVA